MIDRAHVAWRVLFLLLCASLALPFLLAGAPPMLDYPNHLARVFILAHLHDPAYHFAQAYVADWKPYPYILWDAALVALQRVMPVESAGKSMLILSALLVPLAAAWILRQANPESSRLAFLACALACNLYFLWGFCACQLGLGLGLLMVGAWLWYRKQPSPWRAVLFAGLCFAAYFAHLMGFAAAAFILVFYELTGRNRFECLKLAGFLAGPSLLFLWAKPGIRGAAVHFEWRPLSEKLETLKDCVTHGYHPHLEQAFLAGLIVCVLLAVVRNSALRIQWRWAIVTLAFFGLYLALPYAWGESFDLDARLLLPLAILPMAGLNVGRRRANWIAAVAVLLTLLRVFDITQGYREAGSAEDTMDRGIQHVARNAHVFPLVDTCTEDDPLADYYTHYWSYAVPRRGASSPDLFDIPGQTPMRILDDSYTNDGYWEHCYKEEPDWRQVASDYDTIWSYGDQRFTAAIRAVADPVYAEGRLVVYRVRPGRSARR
jgi:hypothetical protein